MSYQGYVENLAGSDGVAKAAIIGISGGVLATTEGHLTYISKLKDEEVNCLSDILKYPSDASAKSIVAGGNKYFYLSGDERYFQAKDKDRDEIVCMKSKQSIVVAQYHGEQQARGAQGAVGKVVDYLVTLGQ